MPRGKSPDRVETHTRLIVQHVYRNRFLMFVLWCNNQSVKCPPNYEDERKQKFISQIVSPDLNKSKKKFRSQNMLFSLKLKEKSDDLREDRMQSTKDRWKFLALNSIHR